MSKSIRCPECQRIVWPLSHHIADDHGRRWHMDCWSTWLNSNNFDHVKLWVIERHNG